MANIFTVTQLIYNFTATIVNNSFTVTNENTVLTITPAPIVTVSATNFISTAEVVTNGIISVLAPSTATVYTTSGNGISQTFQLTPAPMTSDYLEVVVGGVVQVPGVSYTVGDVNTSTVTITFSEAPPAGTNNITFRYYSILVAETIQGPRGYVGPTGPSGPRGPSGPSGVSGPSGPSGQNGTNGTNGTNGDPGPSGPSGPSGGPSGPSGPAGDREYTPIAASAYLSSPQSIVVPAGTGTVVARLSINTKIFDTNNLYSISTYQLTPSAGYYQVNVNLDWATDSGTLNILSGAKYALSIYQNGNPIKTTWQSGPYAGITLSDIIQATGTDYYEFYVFIQRVGGGSTGTVITESGSVLGPKFSMALIG